MTQGADMGNVALRSLLLSLIATIVTVPYFYYLLSVVAEKGGVIYAPDPWLLSMELLLTFILLFLCAIIGLSFFSRLGLPGFGETKNLLSALPILLTIGAVMIALSYFLFDRYFIGISPHSYPDRVIYLITLPLKGALTDETILRLGLLTICAGLFKNKAVAVIFVSALASLFTIRYLEFMGIDFNFDYLVIIQMLLAFSSNLILGYLFVTRGFIHCMAFKFILGCKYIVIAIIMGGGA